MSDVSRGAGDPERPGQSTVTAQFLLLEFCPGTLADRVERWSYPVPWSAAASFALDITSAVEVRPCDGGVIFCGGGGGGRRE